MTTYRQPTNKPTRKVRAGAFGAGVVYLVAALGVRVGIELDEATINLLVRTLGESIGVAVASLAPAYFVREDDQMPLVPATHEEETSGDLHTEDEEDL